MGHHYVRFQPPWSELGESFALEGENDRHRRQVEGDEEGAPNLQAVDLLGLQGEIRDRIGHSGAPGQVARAGERHYDQEGEAVFL